MNAAISITAVRRMALGKDQAARGLIAVLGAFFDDSGTDADSPICVIGGLLGTDVQWDIFANAWAMQLQNPLPGKPPLSQFHLTDCINLEKEFAAYTRPEADHVQYLFRQIIVQSDIITIAIAVDKVAWRELVTADLVNEMGEPIELCFVKCMERVIANGRRYRAGEPISVFFDQGTDKQLRIWKYLYDSQKPIYPELDLITFAPVAKVYPLQGADTVATGTFHYNKDWIKSGGSSSPNPHFRDFIKRRYSEGFFINRDAIAEAVNAVRAKLASRKKPS